MSIGQRLAYDRPMPLDPAVAQYIEDNAIPHETMECDPDLADTAEFCAAYGVPLDHSANAILVASKKPPDLYAVCLVLATSRLDVNGTVRRKLGARKVSFATAEQTIDNTAMEIGGVTVFGLPEDLPVWIDSQVMTREWVIVGAGSRSAKVRVDPQVFTSLSRFQIVEQLAKEIPID